MNGPDDDDDRVTAGHDAVDALERERARSPHGPRGAPPMAHDRTMEHDMPKVGAHHQPELEANAGLGPRGEDDDHATREDDE